MGTETQNSGIVVNNNISNIVSTPGPGEAHKINDGEAMSANNKLHMRKHSMRGIV